MCQNLHHRPEHSGWRNLHIEIPWIQNWAINLNASQCNIRAPWVRLMRHALPWISSKTKSKTKYYKGSSVSCFGPFAWRPIISWSRLQPDLNFLWLQALTQHKFNTSIQQKLQPFKPYLPGSSNVTSSKAQFPLFGEQLAWECRDLESNLRATSRVCAKVHSWHNAKRALCIQDGPGRTIAATEFVGNCVPRLHQLSLSHLDSSEKNQGTLDRIGFLVASCNKPAMTQRNNSEQWMAERQSKGKHVWHTARQFLPAMTRIVYWHLLTKVNGLSCDLQFAAMLKMTKLEGLFFKSSYLLMRYKWSGWCLNWPNTKLFQGCLHRRG